MGIHVVRYRSKESSAWGVVHGETVRPIPGQYDTLAQFLKEGAEQARQLAKEAGTGDGIPVGELHLESPVSAPCRIICQGANYMAHRLEANMSAEKPPYNLIFSKADSALTGPRDNIVCPPHVELLDYEIELGLVIGASITEPQQVTDENLHQYIAGLVITNDVSARDVQLLQSQWLKGKSYRTFCPVGPYLYLLDPEDGARIHDLDLNLWVNGELRQTANTAQLLYKPAETLTELTGLMNFSPGDLIMTGTPGGVALRLTEEDDRLIASRAVPFGEKRQAFVERQRKHKYLQPGDVVRCEIRSKDGAIDLGVLENKVVKST
jgi:2-keto-4-pentenoate hydratase/2-oxohepta-3-ene-1,7-dioic acid hydratase in catechol pathway